MKKLLVGFLALAITVSVGIDAFANGADDQEQKEVKIGFIVKDGKEPWFQEEWKFAEQAAQEKNFTLVKFEATDGESLMTAIDNLGAQQAQGFIVCTPDVTLGTAIQARARANSLKLMSVDDRLLDNAGKPIEEVVHMGISAYKIGNLVGQSIMDEAGNRDWNMDEVYAIRVTFDELPTARDRTNGATESLLKNGFKEANILDAPQKYGTEGAFNAANIVIAKTPNAKKWVIFGLNDEAVIGSVRALEGNGFKTDDIIGVGIGGSDSGLNEFKKENPTGFFGTVVLSPLRHGYETSINMYNWISTGIEPEKLIYTSGVLATRTNYEEVRKSLGL